MSGTYADLQREKNVLQEYPVGHSVSIFCETIQPRDNQLLSQYFSRYPVFLLDFCLTYFCCST